MVLNSSIRVLITSILNLQHTLHYLLNPNWDFCLRHLVLFVLLGTILCTLVGCTASTIERMIGIESELRLSERRKDMWDAYLLQLLPLCIYICFYTCCACSYLFPNPPESPVITYSYIFLHLVYPQSSSLCLPVLFPQSFTLPF